MDKKKKTYEVQLKLVECWIPFSLHVYWKPKNKIKYSLTIIINYHSPNIIIRVLICWIFSNFQTWFFFSFGFLNRYNYQSWIFTTFFFIFEKQNKKCEVLIIESAGKALIVQKPICSNKRHNLETRFKIFLGGSWYNIFIIKAFHLFSLLIYKITF